MLKGHTKIELTNVRTGEKEVVEKHNLVTNAVEQRINNLMMTYGNSKIKSEFFPMYTMAMGGILLFENKLLEDKNNIELPLYSENPITGYASDIVNSGTDIKKGSRNLTESTLLENGYRYVWDFGTSQANGQISALALTSKRGGDSPWAAAGVRSFSQSTGIGGDKQIYSSYGTFNTFFTIVSYDSINNIVTGIKTESETVCRITKVRWIYNNVKFTENFDVLEFVEEKIVDISDSNLRFSFISTSNAPIWLDGGDGYYYEVRGTGELKLYLIRMNAETYEIDFEYGKKEVNTDISVLTYRDYNTSSSVYNCNVGILNGYVFIRSNSAIQKINLINTDDKETIECTSTGSLMMRIGNFFLCGNLCLFDNLHYEIDTTYINDAYNTFNRYCTNLVANKNGIIIKIYNDRGILHIWRDHISNYLATINNLETPVTKTADKTMKITYTITEE